MIALEYALSIVQILSTCAFFLGCLSYTSLIPYVEQYRWVCFAMSGAMYTLLNGRDLHVILRSSNVRSGAALLENDDGELDLRAERNVRGPINWDTFSSLSLTVGSLLLFNSAIVAMIKSADDGACRWQFVGCFSAFVTGYASNTLSFHEDVCDVLETRNVVVFQMSIACILNLVGALLDAPDIVCNETTEQRLTVRAWLHAIGGLLTMVASLVNHFHCLAFMMNEEILYGERQYRRFLKSKAKGAEESATRPRKGILRELWEKFTDRSHPLRTTSGNRSRVGYDDEVYVSLDSDSMVTEYSESSSLLRSRLSMQSGDEDRYTEQSDEFSVGDESCFLEGYRMENGRRFDEGHQHRGARDEAFRDEYRSSGELGARDSRSSEFYPRRMDDRP